MTRSQLRRLLENADYWRDRETAQREAYILTEEEEMREVNRIYRDMYRWAEREISAFYGRYADAEGIDITEAKRRVSNLDIERYEELAKKYVADKDFSDRANQEMRLYNATMRINRMELLKAQIGLKLVDGFNDIDKHYEKIATDRAVQELQRMSGILGNTLTDVQTAKYARNVVNADFYNANFSERIWSHMDNLRSDLAIELQKGFIAGVSTQEMARRIKEHAFEKSYKDAHRLVVTELRRVQTDVAKQQYEEAGIEEYEYCAVNPRACPICRELDKQVFKVADMRAGENAPPIHPNCHCTTAPKVNETEYEQWLSWLENGGTTAQWDQMSNSDRQSWYNKIKDNTPITEQPKDNLVYTEAKNHTEATNYLKGKLGFVGASFKGVPIKTVNEVNKTITRLYNKYPQLNGFIQKVKVDNNCGGVAEFGIEYKNGKVKTTLTLNPNDLQSLDAIGEMVKENVESGYWSYCEGVEGIIEHEFGHALEAQRAFAEQGVDPLSTNVNEQIDRWQAVQKYKRHEIAERELTEAFADSNITLSEDNIEKYISGYAKEDYHNAGDYAEAFAEAISDNEPNSITGHIQNKARGW